MIHYTTPTSARLEGFARARGLDLGIVVSPDNCGGKYFVVSDGPDLLIHWIGLGWTRDEAEAALADWGLSRL